ncbi:hypothetical protein ACFPRL_23625 [Pseudoclavibacter helvolus]
MDRPNRPQEHGRQTTLAEATLQVHLLRVHEEAFVETVHAAERVRREHHDGAYDPVDVNGCPWRGTRIVSNCLVPPP